MFHAIFKSHFLTTEMNGVSLEVTSGMRGQMIPLSHNLSDMHNIKMYKFICLDSFSFTDFLSSL